MAHLYTNKKPEGANENLPLHRSTSEPDIRRRKVHNEVAEQAFAGRLGGGGVFTLSPTTTANEKKNPDAFSDATWAALLSPAAFSSLALWKLAFIEGVGTALQTFLSGVQGHGLVPTVTETSIGPVFPVALASIAQIFLISLFIWCAGPVTGAHFNPVITIGTFCAKLSSLPRTVLYVGFQCLGGVVGGFLVRAALGVGPEALAILPGCYVDPKLVTPGQAYAFEVTSAFAQLFLAFGLGLDPRNATAFGPALAPLLIGLSSALLIFFTGFARQGYLGTCNNPARCLGLMAAANRFDYHYIHWTGDITAAVINGLLYVAVPPYKRG